MLFVMECIGYSSIKGECDVTVINKPMPPLSSNDMTVNVIKAIIKQTKNNLMMNLSH